MRAGLLITNQRAEKKTNERALNAPMSSCCLSPGPSDRHDGPSSRRAAQEPNSNQQQAVSLTPPGNPQQHSRSWSPHQPGSDDLENPQTPHVRTLPCHQQRDAGLSQHKQRRDKKTAPKQRSGGRRVRILPISTHLFNPTSNRPPMSELMSNSSPPGNSSTPMYPSTPCDSSPPISVPPAGHKPHHGTPRRQQQWSVPAGCSSSGPSWAVSKQLHFLPEAAAGPGAAAAAAAAPAAAAD